VFADWLREAGVKLVYLSCPHGSSTAAALEQRFADDNRL
jgi:hypothetical protein